VRRERSLRRSLTSAYAGIALLTALLLGLILALILPPFFAQLEATYLRGAAAEVVNGLKQAGGIGPGRTARLDTEVLRIAEATKVRIRVKDRKGRVIADSGPATDSAAVSDAVREDPFLSRDGRVVGRVEVSEGPKPGQDVAARIAWAWLIASSFAVGLSATAGYFLAGRVSRPVTELTRISGEMAHGDLSVRADVEGDVEVRMLASAFNEMADGIEGSIESLRRFVGDAAHEIGTPLTALQADLELARENPADPDVPDLLDRSLAHTERISLLSRDLLALSRLESVGAIAEQQRVDLRTVASAVTDGVASRAEQAEIELEFVAEQAPVEVNGDAAALSRAVGNLLDNALKFTPAGGDVSVAVHRDGADALVCVRDTGVGIAPQELPHVFERFHRARSTASVPGSGLGLAIVKAIVDAHRGRVSVTSSPAGTSFEIRIPLA
jgi:signal transduction histidine kinase